MTGAGRCPWALGNERMTRYHDEEWGVPVHGDRRHFEFLVLDAFQAGLSWSTILDKREHFREAFSGFDPERVAGFGRREVARLLRNPGIVRNRQKIEATVRNARAFLEIVEAEDTFDRFIWTFVGGTPAQYRRRSMQAVPAQSRASQAMSRTLKERGFSFVGPTICYAYMQAAGLVNDHLVSCFRHAEVRRLAGEEAE